MGKMSKRINKNINPGKLLSLKDNVKKINNYIEKSKLFFSNLDKLLQNNDSTKEDIINLYTDFKEKLGVK